MTAQDELVAALTEALRPRGFKRRGLSWFRLGPALYSVINLQPSRWDESFYLNVAFSPASEITKVWLPESKCMVRFRLDALNDVSVADLKLLDEVVYRQAQSDHWRNVVREGIIAPIARLIDDVGDMAGLRNLLQTEIGGRAMVHREVRELLDLPNGSS